jgi:hypothetical protein
MNLSNRSRLVLELFAAILVFAVSTVVFNIRTIAGIREQRACPTVVMEQHPPIMSNDDTGEFLRLLDESASALKQGRIYFPVSDYDCPLSFLLPAGAVRLLTGLQPLVVLNLFFLVVFFLNGLAAYWFFRSVGGYEGLALLFGVFYQSTNFVFLSHHMGHMNNAQIQWIPIIFVGAIRLLAPEANLMWALLLGLTLGLQILSSPSYTVYVFCTALPIFITTYLFAARRNRALQWANCQCLFRNLGIAGLVAVSISAVYLIPRVGSMPVKYPQPTWLPFALHDCRQLLDPTHPLLFIGLPMFVLIILSTQWWLSNRDPLTTAIAVTMICSLSMMLPAVPGMPYWIFYEINPLFRHLRVPARFFPIFFLMLLALSIRYLTDSKRATSFARSCWTATSLFCLHLIFYWLSSPWILHVDIVRITKDMLGKK